MSALWLLQATFAGSGFLGGGDMFSSPLLETKWPRTCQRCGGQLIRSYDDINCLQCGAPHTQEGKLMPVYFTQEVRQTRKRMTTLKEERDIMVMSV